MIIETCPPRALSTEQVISAKVLYEAHVRPEFLISRGQAYAP